MQLAMVINLTKCMGCHTCSVACKAQWLLPENSGRSWLRRFGPAQTSKGIAYTFYSGRCNHCDRPQCVDVCPVPPVSRTFADEKANKIVTIMATATWKDPLDGTVQIDIKRCIGCGACVEACPYGARYMRAMEGNQKKKVADKCTFCVELLSKGQQPACVKNCLSEAIVFGDLSDPESEVARLVKNGAVRLTSPEVNIGPNIFYVGTSKDVGLLLSEAAPTQKHRVSDRRSLLKALINVSG
jgi:tetrathionate reductase subunit B